MKNNVKIDYKSDNLAVPEVEVEDEQTAAQGETGAEECEDGKIAFDNLAFPEIHIKKENQ